MNLERTISQLDIGSLPEDRACELGHMGFIQWLAGLPSGANFHDAAQRALTLARPFAETSPAVAVFCDLVTASAEMPPRPLALDLPLRNRRGGARARRGAL